MPNGRSPSFWIRMYSAVISRSCVGVSVKLNFIVSQRTPTSSIRGAALWAARAGRVAGSLNTPRSTWSASERDVVESRCGVWSQSNLNFHRPRRPTLNENSWSAWPHFEPSNSVE